MPARDTKARILDAAERLFAERGIDGTSLRSVTRAAGVNLAAVHYHLGSKEGLLEAVMARRIAPVNEARLKRLDALEGEAQGEPIPVEALLDAFLRPALEMVATEERGLLFARMMCRIYWEAGDAFREVVIAQFRGVAERFIDSLERSLAPMPFPEVVARFQYVLAVLIHELADPQRMRNASFPMPDDNVATRLARMVAFLSAGVRVVAPAPPPPSAPKAGGVT